MEPREAERFEEGIEPAFQDAEEVETGESGERIETEVHESGAFHGGFGSATLQERLDRINQSRTDALATCHSGVKSDESTNPPQFAIGDSALQRPVHAVGFFPVRLLPSYLGYVRVGLCALQTYFVC